MIKNLKELRKQSPDLVFENWEDMEALAINFVRCVTWKKEREHAVIQRLYFHVFPLVLLDINKNGWDVALKTIKNGDLKKAINIKKIFEYYGLNYLDYKALIIEEKKKILV